MVILDRDARNDGKKAMKSSSRGPLKSRESQLDQTPRRGMSGLTTGVGGKDQRFRAYVSRSRSLMNELLSHSGQSDSRWMDGLPGFSRDAPLNDSVGGVPSPGVRPLKNPSEQVFGGWGEKGLGGTEASDGQNT